jgi:hypothetical protein
MMVLVEVAVEVVDTPPVKPTSIPGTFNFALTPAVGVRASELLAALDVDVGASIHERIVSQS